MRHYLFVIALVALAPAFPSTAFAQSVVLAQADTQKESEAGDNEEAGADEGVDEEPSDAAEGEAKPDDEAADDATAEDLESGESAEDKAPETRIPLTANFSRAEIITASTVYVGGLGLVLAGPLVFDAPRASMGTPAVGSLDYRISSRFHGDLADPGKFLLGIPDFVGSWGLTAGGSIFYLGSAAYYWGTGDTLFGQSVNFDHSAIGFIEAVGWTALATGVTKHLAGRERPYKGLNRPEFADSNIEPEDADLSFFSGHTSLSFSIASYMAWDLSDHLVSQGSGFWTGRVLPFAGFYGVAGIVGISRIYDQRHYFSDVMAGAIVGSLIGNLVYVAHFDSDGDPRIRHPEALEEIDVSLAPITTISGDSGVGLVGNW